MINQKSPAGSIVPADVAGLVEAKDFQGVSTDLLPKLDLEDHIPSVRPWLRMVSTAIFGSAALTIVFITICPYKVVVRAQGEIGSSSDQILVNAPFSGRVANLMAKANQAIRAGSAILVLDPTSLRGDLALADRSSVELADQKSAQRAQSQSDLARARLEVDKAQAALSFAETEYERYQQLVAAGAASTSLVSAKKAEATSARAAYFQALESLEIVKSQARNSQAELNKEIAREERTAAETRRNLVKTIVRSPVNGIVFKMAVESLQQTVGQGQLLATITPHNAKRVAKVNVRSEDVIQVKPGQRADLRLVGCPYPDFGTLPARVVEVAPDADSTTDLYAVTLMPERDFLSAGQQRCTLKVGMPLQADITTREETLLRFVLRKARMLVG